MLENTYRMAGEVTIPDEKRDEFNRRVLRILDRGGIRKTHRMQVGNHEITVLVPATPDENGIVSFNYSIFEKMEREVATFNTITGELIAPDRGYSEYAIVVSAIMVLQEAYSSTPCFFTHEGKPEQIKVCIAIIDDLLGETIHLHYRPDVWKLYSFFHESNEYDDIDIFEAYRLCNAKSIEQIIMVICLLEENIELTDEVGGMCRAEMQNAKNKDKREYLYRLFLKHPDETSFEEWLSELLSSDLETRLKLSEASDDYGEIAEISTHFYSQVVAKIYSTARGEDFWQVWDRIGQNCYDDIIHEDEKYSIILDDDHLSFKLREAIQRDTDDEMLEWWDGQNLQLSDEMTRNIDLWKNMFTNITIPSQLDAEQLLGDILYEMSDCWDCRYVDKAFVDEFLEDIDASDYRKILLVLWEQLNEGVELFPELTRKQAIYWVLRRTRNSFFRICIAAYVSLMGNKTQRKRLFGV
ncbi:MAG: hypothetical protein IKQ97_07050 [Eubacterium sp.]|nr:hypothetical protein [Eubacterium sp.]